MWFLTCGAKEEKWVFILLPPCGRFLLWQLAGSLKYHSHPSHHDVFLEICLCLNVSNFDPNEHNACSCRLSSSSDSSRAAVCKVTVLILNDTSCSVTDTPLNLWSKTVAIMPSLTVCYKKYEEWHTLAQNMRRKLQSYPFCYFCMIQAWMPFHEETYFNLNSISHFLWNLLRSLENKQSICKFQSLTLKQSTDDPSGSILKMAVACSPEMVTSYQTTRSHIP
jgi:hypothetical protein